MRNYILIYELNNPADHYEEFHHAVRHYEDWLRLSRNIYLIKSHSLATLINDYLSQYIGKNDKLYVIQIYGDAAYTNSDMEIKPWISNP